MKVIHVLPGLNPGGIETLVLNLIPKLEKNGIDNKIVSLSSVKGSMEKEFLRTGAEIDKVSKRGSLDISVIPKLVDIFSTEEVDIIHTHDRSLVVRAAARASLKPLVTTYQNFFDPKIRSESFVRKILMWAENVVNNIRLLDDVSVSVSRYVHDTHFHNSKVSNTKRVNHNSVNPQKILKNTTNVNVKEARRQLGIDANSFVIGNVARLADQKGHIYLIRAAKILSEEWSNLEILVVGDGPKRDLLKDESSRLGLTDTVKFLGSRRDVHRLLSIMDLFAFPSLWEGFPLALLEAMSAKLPVVATEIGPHPELVNHGETGYLVEPKNPQDLALGIHNLIDSDEKRESFGKAALSRVKNNFTISKCASKYINIYEWAKSQNV